MECKEKYCDNCSSLYLVNFFTGNGFSNETTNATVTYIKCNGRYFCITAKHVIDALEKINAGDGPSSHQLMTTKGDLYFTFLLARHHQNGVEIKSTFKQSSPSFEFEYKKDLAIFEIPEQQALIYFDLMQKEPIDFDRQYNRSCEWVCAVGYPDNMKQLKNNSQESMVASSCCRVQIEVSSGTLGREFTCCSDIGDNNYNFSGMSGGPIFSIEEKDSALIGICFESDRVEQNKNTVFIRCQTIEPADLLQFDISPSSLPIISGYHYSAKRKNTPWILFTLDHASRAVIDAIREIKN